MLVSIVIPVYNEEPAICEILRRVIKAPMPEGFNREIIIVDDGSSDETVAMVESFISDEESRRKMIKLHRGLVNHGKGAALRAGFRLVKGDLVLVQDGDLEYDPNDYPILLAPFKDEAVEVVYGSRMTDGLPKDMKLPNKVANLILTWTTRILYGQNITDEATGFKVFRADILDRIKLACLRFEFCPEFTGKISKIGIKIHEVPISYSPRGILEGKKIRPIDGFIAVWWLFKVRFSA